MDWIDGWYETSTPAMRQQIGVDRVTINCKGLSIRTTPQSCISWIQANPTAGITQYVVYTKAASSTIQAEAAQYSAYSVGSPVTEVDVDDFFGDYMTWYGSMANAGLFLSQTIDKYKSVNPNLKFGITLYENELDPIRNPYIDNVHLPAAVKAKFDVIRLWLHYRANGPNYAAYVAQAKALFPNAQIVAGVYAYDRIDYFPCSQTSSAVCTQQQEMTYFQQALTIQVQLLQQGAVAGLDVFPGYFGAETDLFGPGPNSDSLTCSNVTRCVQNTIAMRDAIVAAKADFQSGVVPSITKQPTNTSLLPGQTQIFPVTATGTAPLSYQWKKNGVAIAGATAASYHTPAATAADNNSIFTCVVSNAYGSVTSNPAILAVTVPGIGPAFTTQPTNTNLLAGQTQIFSITATGTAPLSYQWMKNAVAIASATAASYHTPPVTMSDNNSVFRCVVTNAYASVTSIPGNLVVSLPAAIEAIVDGQPQPQVYPNPWRADRHARAPITFSHLAAGSTVKIFSLSARLVKTLTAAPDTAVWDRTSDSGPLVSSGLYIYLLTNQRGQTVHGRLAIIN